MAKAAFSTWNDRIAPVFDVAQSIHLVEIEGDRIVRLNQVGVTSEMANLRTARLVELGVDTLVCGAISRPLQAMISAYGIQVIAFVAGDLQEIIQAWACGKLAGSADYAMPGCRSAGGQRWFNADNANRRKSKMNSDKGRRKGSGRGQGSGGQGRRGQGRGGGSRASGANPGTAAATRDTCVCPQCGHLTPHERGVPCAQKKCPQCGTIMTRQ